MLANEAVGTRVLYPILDIARRCYTPRAAAVSASFYVPITGAALAFLLSRHGGRKDPLLHYCKRYTSGRKTLLRDGCSHAVVGVVCLG